MIAESVLIGALVVLAVVSSARALLEECKHLPDDVRNQGE